MTRVLIIDDEPGITGMLRRFLDRTGRFEVRTENHSLEAVGAAVAFRPHVIVLDVCMPGMDGPEVAKAMANIPELRNVPVLFLTGLATPDEIGPSGWRSGDRAYLPKPVGLHDFVRSLDRVSGLASA